MTLALSDKLGRQTGCKVMQVGVELLNDVKVMVEERKLEWKDVAFIGNLPLQLNVSREQILCSQQEFIQNVMLRGMYFVNNIKHR